MFNLKSQKTINDVELLKIEMRAFDIVKSADGYSVRIGDEVTPFKNLTQCQEALGHGILELKEHTYKSWNDLNTIVTRIFHRPGKNSGSLDNLLFLNAAKRCHALSLIFPELKEITSNLHKLLDQDIEQIDDHLINHFNSEYITIHSLHRLMMDELFRQKLVHRFMHLTKQAQISGPWANLDLPMEERVWEDDAAEQDYFDNRQKSRRQQTRYNPENTTSSGFYYVWQDFSGEPYLFEDREEKSPYKSRLTMNIASKNVEIKS